jgi:hypothetical protein
MLIIVKSDYYKGFAYSLGDVLNRFILASYYHVCRCLAVVQTPNSHASSIKDSYVQTTRPKIHHQKFKFL